MRKLVATRIKIREFKKKFEEHNILRTEESLAELVWSAQELTGVKDFTITEAFMQRWGLTLPGVRTLSAKIKAYHNMGIYFHDCVYCGKVCAVGADQTKQENWYPPEKEVKEQLHKKINSSSGYCPDCYGKELARIRAKKNER